jgi:shikimate kinase
LLHMTDETVPPRLQRESAHVSRVALVGFMGAGKTSVGTALAERMGWRFMDLDVLIEKREGRSVPQIFEQDGEAKFRELEWKALQEILTAADSRFLVLALGGGAFISKSIRELLRERDVPAVWLDAPADELFRRCEQPDLVRPLRRDQQQFAKLYEQRLSSYRQADLHVITTNKEIRVVAEEIVAQFGLRPGTRSAE